MCSKIKVRYNIKTDVHGSDCGGTIEFEKAAWEALTQEEREDIMRDYAFEHVEWTFYETE